MRWYKILARILLMLSVIGFTLAAPVIVQEHEVRVSGVDAAKDRTATSPLRWDPSNKWLANAEDRTNALPILRSSDFGHWRKQEPRQHNPRLRTDSNGSPEPSNPAPPIDPYVHNPRSPSPSPGGSTSPSPTSQAPTNKPVPSNPPSPHDDSHVFMSTTTHGTPPPDGSQAPQITSGESRSSGKNNPNSPVQLSKDESHPLSPGQIVQPLQTPPSEPGLSTRPHLPPGAESSYEVENAAMTLMAMSDEVKSAAMTLITMSRQGFRPRTYGSGAVDAAKGELLGTIDTRVSMVGGLDKFLNVPAAESCDLCK